MNNSIWEEVKIKNINSEIKDFDTDVLIIGGGITGLSCAYFLKDSNLDITVIDKSNIGHGITCKTTAKVHFLQGAIYQDLENYFNKDISKKYFESQIDAIGLVKGIIDKEKIKCDLEETDAYIFTKEDKDIKKIKREKELLESWNIKCKEVDSLPILFPIKYGIMVKDNYVFHPLKYINGLINSIKDNINIYENVLAYEIEPQKDNTYIVRTNKNTIKCKYVVVACFYPFFTFPGLIPIKTYIKREYINSSKYDNVSNFTAISVGGKLHSIRFYKDYIIYGSNDHKLTNRIRYKNNYKQSMTDFKRLFSKDPEYTWMNQDLMTNDYLPLIGSVNKNNSNILLACGYNAWGMTNSTIAGKILSDIILKKKNRYIDLFKPDRMNAVGIINSIISSGNYAKIYIQTIVKKNHTFDNKNVYTVKINGEYYGVYCDNYNKKHIVKLLCPHLKCYLVFNEQELTWDCPCHGSRFDIDGNVLCGPSKESIKVKSVD